MQELIEAKGLFPITIFKTINEKTKEKLFKAKIVLAKDLTKYKIDGLIKKTGLNKNVLKITSF